LVVRGWGLIRNNALILFNMRKLVLTVLTSLAWLLASPSIQLPEFGWVEVGATPATAQTVDEAKEPAKAVKPTKKKSAQKKSRPARVGSSGVVRSNQPGFHSMRPITAPQSSVTTGTVTTAPPVTGYPTLQTVPIIPRGATGGAGLETSQDRVIRCQQQSAINGLSPGQQGTYIQNCAF
jgi:hypothetical protein